MSWEQTPEELEAEREMLEEMAAERWAAKERAVFADLVGEYERRRENGASFLFYDLVLRARAFDRQTTKEFGRPPAASMVEAVERTAAWWEIDRMREKDIIERMRAEDTNR